MSAKLIHIGKLFNQSFIDFKIFSHIFYICNLLFLNSIKLYSDLIFLFSIHALHSFLQNSDKLSTRSDNLPTINLKLSINFSLHVIVLPLSSSFLIGTEKYFCLNFLLSIQIDLQILLLIV